MAWGWDRRNPVEATAPRPEEFADVPGRRVGQALLRGGARGRLGGLARHHDRGGRGSRPPRALELVLPRGRDGGASPQARRVGLPGIVVFELRQSVRRVQAAVNRRRVYIKEEQMIHEVRTYTL